MRTSRDVTSAATFGPAATLRTTRYRGRRMREHGADFLAGSAEATPLGDLSLLGSAGDRRTEFTIHWYPHAITAPPPLQFHSTCPRILT